MKAGLEVHQQLATRKLFCDCPTELEEEGGSVVVRTLRATGGEERQVDPAAEFQAGRGLSYAYEIVRSSCLVDLDEEPPHPINPEALDVALTVAVLLQARIVDEIEVMRKIVVDGSNTSGFQRTALIALDGRIEVEGHEYSISTVCLEEDAARKVGEEHGTVRYRLDRLGVPLVEIATGPDLHSGEEARAVAEELGALLRATGKVRRGIGTIREDLNVSIEGGRRVELKGVQELRLIHRYVTGEADRQAFLLRLRDELRARGASVPEGSASVDVTDELRGLGGGPVADLVNRGGVVVGLRLPGFAGLLGPQPNAEDRLGRELADHARAAGLRGLLHSDELPNDTLDRGRVDAVRRKLGTQDVDGFVLLAAPSKALAGKAADAVLTRARRALEGVPGETRDPLPDGRTRYSRPLPGRNRMYPETDVPPIRISEDRLARLRAQLPELPAVTRARLLERYQVSPETVNWLLRNGEVDRFEALVTEGHAPTLVARLLSQELPAAFPPTRGLDPRALPLTSLNELLTGVAQGRYAKEAIPGILAELAHGAPTLSEAARRSGAAGMSSEDLERIAAEIVERNQALVDARGSAAFQPLMGDLMREVRGRRDGQEVAEVLRRVLNERLAARTSGG